MRYLPDAQRRWKLQTDRRVLLTSGRKKTSCHGRTLLLLYTGKIRHGAAQAFFEGDFRLPPHGGLCLLVGEHRTVDIALTSGLVRGTEFLPYGLAKDCDEVVEARLRLRTEVVGRISVVCRQRMTNAIRDIPRIDEVACLAAIAEDRQWLSLCHALRKDADDAALVLVTLTFTVDIGKAQHDVVEAVELMVEREVTLCHDLCQPIERQWLKWQLFPQWQQVLCYVAIRRRRRGEDHTLHSTLRRAASSTFTVPITFSLASKCGSRIDASTIVWPARCTIASKCPAMMRSRVSGARSSSSQNAKPSAGRCSRTPVDRLSSTVTL